MDETLARGGAVAGPAGSPPALPTVDPDLIRDVLRHEGARVVGTLRAARSLRAPAPGLAWDAGEVAAHLSVVYRAFAGALDEAWQRAPEDLADAPATAPVEIDLLIAEAEADPRMPAADNLPDHLAIVNDLVLRDRRGETPGQAADALEAALDRMVRALQPAGDLSVSCATPWYGAGFTRTSATLMALSVSETLLHGRDIALALGADPAVSDASASVASGTVMSRMLPVLLDAQKATRARVLLRIVIPDSGRFLLRIAGARAESLPDDGRPVDATMTMTASAALLLGLGRVSPRQMVVRGRLRVTGRRPWAALALTRYFLTP